MVQERYILTHDAPIYVRSRPEYRYVGKTGVFVENPARFTDEETALGYLNSKWVEIIKCRVRVLSMFFQNRAHARDHALIASAVSNLSRVGVAIERASFTATGDFSTTVAVSRHFPTETVPTNRFVKYAGMCLSENISGDDGKFKIFEKISRRPDFSDFRYIVCIGGHGGRDIDGSEVFATCFAPTNIAYLKNWMAIKTDEDMTMARLRFNARWPHRIEEIAKMG